VSAQATYAPKVCPACSITFTPRRYDQSNCSRACKNTADNLAAARAKSVYQELYHWAKNSGRNGYGSCLTDLSKMARKWVKEDEEAGRAPPAIPMRIQNEQLTASYEARMKEADRMLAE